MVKIGITGGIGSGKTEVCEEWKALGAYILNADDLAKSLMISDNQIREEVIKVFGREAYLDDGSLNRPYLADQAFRKGRVNELNAIVHPKLPAAVKNEIKDAQKEGYPVFVLEAALLLQNGNREYLDYIIIVLADDKKRIERVSQRDEVSEDLVIDRLESQQDFNRLTHQADFIIENNGSLADLKKKARDMYKKFLQH